MNELINTSKNHDISFDTYKKWFQRFQKNNDVRELNFQNEIIKPFINSICPNFDVIDVSIKVNNPGKHNYLHYCGTYKDEKGIIKPHTPDLIIAKDWNWHNNTFHVDYRAVVEVKSPFGNEPLFHKEYTDYSDKIKTKLNSHLSSEKNDKLILTDTLKWEFYEKDSNVPIRIFKLYDMKGRGKWKWKTGEKQLIDNEVTSDIFKVPIEDSYLVDEFEKLKLFLKDFLNYKD